jgi:hypothetical protein
MIAAAVSAGWEFESDEPGLALPGVRVWGGLKDLGVGLGQINIGLDPNDEEPRTIGIRLSFDEEYPPDSN